MPRGLPVDRIIRAPKRHCSDVAEMQSRSPRRQSNNHDQRNDAADLLRSLPLVWRLLFVVCVVNTLWIASTSMNHYAKVGDGLVAIDRTQANSKQHNGRVLQVEARADSDSTVMVVLVSNRLDGMIATVSSILVHTQTKGVDLVIIGDAETNDKVRQRFVQPQGQRTRVLNSFTSLTVPDVEADLIAQGHTPIWTWDEWHSSMGSDDWFRPNATLHAAEWDHLQTHAHKLNHLRFYLPYLTLFRDRKYLYFVDDDILIRKDLGVITDETLPTLHDSKGMVTPCNIWMWDTTCQRFQFLNETTIGSILDMPSLYGDRKVCKTESETHCYPEHYQEFLHKVLPAETQHNPHPDRQTAWNFGFSLFQLENWKKEELTARYEGVMRASYRDHIFPETSLSFGLGVAYLAFAGSVECWTDSRVRVRDGFGFIEHSRFEKSFGDDFIDNVHVIHYTGPMKPWKPKTTIETASLKPWLEIFEKEGYNIPQQLPDTPSTEVVVVLGGERTGTQWLMDVVDRHPAICAGENGRPETGFSPDSLMPSELSWLPLCSTRRSCSFEYIYDAVLDLQTTLDPRGRYAVYPARCQRQNLVRDPLKENLPRICNFLKALNGNFTDSAIEDMWIDAYRREDDQLIGCSCPRGTRVKALKVLSEWISSKDRPNALKLGALKGARVIRIKRNNLVDRFISQAVAEKTGIYKVTTAAEKLERRRKLDLIELSPKKMIETIQGWQRDDENADNWAANNALELLSLDFEQCLGEPTKCIEQICAFLGVEAKIFAAKISKHLLQREPNESYNEFISNKEEIKRALEKFNLSEYVATW